MKVNGYQLREAIRRWELQRDTVFAQFEDSLRIFPDEEKSAPVLLFEKFLEAEVAIAKLQAAQCRYNLHITISVQGERYTLCEGVKRYGGAGRGEKMWRKAAGGRRERYSSSYEETRRAEDIHAKRTISVEESLRNAKKAQQFAGALRAAINVGNNTEMSCVELELDPKLLTE